MALWHNIAELMDYYIPPLPSVYWIDITRLCDLRCVMCPQSYGLRDHRPTMSLDVFQRIVDDVCENHPLIKLYLSGEPLLHKDLLEMIAYADRQGCRTMIHTNATLLTQTMSQRLLSSALTFLSFSFDGCSAEVYERLRPPARFEQVRSNIRQYLELRRSQGRGPHTSIEIIRMKDTEDLLPDFVTEWKTSGVDEIHVVDCMTWLGCVKDRRIDRPSNNAAYKPCEAPFRHGCILSDGTVVPCCMDVNGMMPLGNVIESSFREIWAGKPYRQLRLAMLTAGFPEGSICAGCANIAREVKHTAP
ncbi:MAG: SPASM domain-containing protein [Sedimentisphaerales bacterium]|nr:SPASM domain-containing protein [Sedimentisphaerales bacterium]